MLSVCESFFCSNGVAIVKAQIEPAPAFFKTVAMDGIPPIQNTLGLTEDVPIYFPTYNFLEEDEVMNPRGWQGSRWGDRLVFSTLEYRVGSQKVSAALISDIANAWVVGRELDDWIITGGYFYRKEPECYEWI